MKVVEQAESFGIKFICWIQGRMWTVVEKREGDDIHAYIMCCFDKHMKYFSLVFIFAVYLFESARVWDDSVSVVLVLIRTSITHTHTYTHVHIML